MTRTYKYSAQDLAVAIKRTGRTCEAQNITMADLRRAFPNRPTTREEIQAIVEWQAEYIRAAKATETSLQGTDTPPAPSQDWSGIATRRNSVGQALASYYAVELEGTLRFFRVKRGYKKGVFFVDVQASDELHSVRSYASKQVILNAIAQDPKAAMERYGSEIGSCGYCHRTLTNELSRERGIGPECWGKYAG